MTRLIRPEGAEGHDFRFSRRAAVAGGLFFAGYAPAALAAQASPVITDAEGLVTADISFPAPDGFDLPAYVARPAGDGPYPVVPGVSEIFGLHE